MKFFMLAGPIWFLISYLVEVGWQYYSCIPQTDRGSMSSLMLAGLLWLQMHFVERESRRYATNR